jgi:hypothetical protein
MQLDGKTTILNKKILEATNNQLYQKLMKDWPEQILRHLVENILRRYWHPVALTSEVSEIPKKFVF